MMNCLSRLVISGEVVPQQRPRATSIGGFTRVYDPPKCSQFRMLVRMEAERVWKKAENAETMFEVHIFFYLSIPKATSLKKRIKMLNGVILPTKKPDLDNAAKGVLDGLTHLYWKDDSQIVNLLLHKAYSDRPRTEVVIYEIKADEQTTEGEKQCN